MQLSQSLQWEERNGLTILHVGHIFAIFKYPLWTNFIGNLFILLKSKFLFIIPGSLKPVFQKNTKWHIVRIIGIKITK